MTGPRRPSAFHDERAREQALSASALASLRKPLDGEELLEVVARAIPGGWPAPRLGQNAPRIGRGAPSTRPPGAGYDF